MCMQEKLNGYIYNVHDSVFSPGRFGVSADIPYVRKGYQPIRLAYVQR